ncbi:MAG: hypothetical protein EA371_13335 [Gammaproteobacteria bacterium]|nr:MAG: hypothetical protein EA371_13335 [Gammaproteobacteria bacterium]
MISCHALEPHLALFGGLMGLHPEGPPQTLMPSATAALFGVTDRQLRVQVLRTPGTRTGIVLLEFDPPPRACIRERDTALHADALKVIDFYSPDFDRMLAHVASAGYSLEPDVAAYELPEGRFQEAHLWGPDNVILGLLGGPREFFKRFATVTDRLFSEVQSLSTPVSDLAAVKTFYRDVLGLSTVYEYKITDPSFGELIGSEETLALHATNVGRRTEEPYFGLIDYGLARDRMPSLRDQATELRRGIVGAVVLVPDLQASLAVARRRGDSQREAVTLSIAGQTEVSMALVQAPHGVEHLLVQVSDIESV